jgi:excisionase family DNA binding protein
MSTKSRHKRKEISVAEHEQMLTPREAGRRFGVTDRTVKRWIEQGKLRGFRPGKAYQVPESAVEELLERSEIRPKEPTPFSLEWARAATDAEFYKAIVEAPEEDIEKLDMLSGTLLRLTDWELFQAAARSRSGTKVPGSEKRPDVAPVSPQEWPVMRARMEAVTKEVKRRRPPFAQMRLAKGGSKCFWYIPPEEWESHRQRVDEFFAGQPYEDVDARADAALHEEDAVLA